MRALKWLGLIVVAALAIGVSVSGAPAQTGYDYPPPPATPPTGSRPAPTLSLTVKANRARVVLRRGIKVATRCNLPCVVKLRAFKGRRTFGTRTKRFPRRGGTMFVRLNQRGKQQVRRRAKAGKALRFAVTGRATDATNRKSSAARARVRVKAAKRG